jgi:hypothetical protein
MYYSLFFYCNSSCTKAHYCYILHTLPVLQLEFSMLILVSYFYIQWITGYRPKTGSHRKCSYARQVFLQHKQLLMLNICPKMNLELVFYPKFSDFRRNVTTLHPFELLVRTARLLIKKLASSLHSEFMCFVCFSEKTVINSLNNIKLLVFISRGGLCLLGCTNSILKCNRGFSLSESIQSKLYVKI